jgi:alkylation response protein AidB-like acyl-CoA dehydrogenase
VSDALILDTIEAFLARDVAPHVHALEKSDTWPAEMVARMRELGLFGATIGA